MLNEAWDTSCDAALATPPVTEAALPALWQGCLHRCLQDRQHAICTSKCLRELWTSGQPSRQHFTMAHQPLAALQGSCLLHQVAAVQCDPPQECLWLTSHLLLCRGLVRSIRWQRCSVTLLRNAFGSPATCCFAGVLFAPSGGSCAV